MKNIRNFVIIAHIDHGKSTLADRLLDITDSVDKRKMKDQFLDDMDLEREKGITIKMRPVRMNYTDSKGEEYLLNLIDTPGHVDFGYEVSRSLAAVEGAILLVDAAQGVQAQTLANYKLAKDEGLEIIPVINKIDLPSARIEESINEIVTLCGVKEEDILLVSAKTGQGVEDIIKEVVKRVPAPSSNNSQSLQALVFDSFYDNHRGIVAHIRVMEGEVKSGDKIYLIAGKHPVSAVEVGFFQPDGMKKAEKIEKGQIGYIATGSKDPEKLRVGDTICLADIKGGQPKDVEALPGYFEPKPMVFASVYPHVEADYELLQKALAKLRLNDAALFYKPEAFHSLGRGFSVGFLGLLHLEIVKERLLREYNLEVILTTPSVSFKVDLKNGQRIDIFRASDLPELDKSETVLEPWAKLEILAPDHLFNEIMKIADYYRLVFKDSEKMSDLQLFRFDAPLMEIIADFYDKLKSVTSGYGSMNYEFLEFRPGDLIRLDFLIAGEIHEPFSRIITRQKAEKEGRRVAQKLKDLLPRENFAVAIQATIGSRIVARETLPALRKDVTGHLYGGDRTRKMKLWKKQKEGKKRMKERGRVNVPPSVYLEVLKIKN